MKYAISMCVAIFVFLLLNVSEANSRLIPQEIVETSKIRVINSQRDIRQIECLADNIYYEARGESVTGQMAVGFVTLNRSRSSIFPNDICSVTSQKRRGTCQFSWQCEPPKKRASRKKLLDKRKDKVYNKIYELSKKLYMDYEKINDPTKGSLYYHANYVKVKRKGKYVKKVIGKHIFYNVKKK